jgi:predicted phage terminase large subunit-like protein
MEKTEPLTAALFDENYVGYALIESNNGGRGFARAVERTSWEVHKNRHTTFKWFTQSKNKLARIHSNSASAQNNIYFPINWGVRWPEFYLALTTYQAKGKNKHDDAPDAFTGLYEMLDKKAIFAGEINVDV